MGGYGLGAYGHYAGYYGVHGNGIKSAPCANAANVPVPCAARKRRDAEADAYYGYAYGGYPYAARAYGYGYGLGGYYGGHLGGYYGGYYGVHPSHYGICRNNLGAQVPC